MRDCDTSTNASGNDSKAITGLNRPKWRKGMSVVELRAYWREWSRWRYGDNPRKTLPLLERFWKKVVKTSTCWNWTGSTKGNGYGSVFISRKVGPASAH